MTEMTTPRPGRVNAIGLAQADYKGLPSTLCQGCGHNSIANQIVQVAYEMNVRPHEMLKLSGIGCSSKSPAYFLGQSFGFNTLHGRMPSLATGALIANHHLQAIAVSGDGDSASIGLGQFKHLLRRNVRMVYVVENNGVYGLTKGQFSATADEGQSLKYAGTNEFPPIDICMEAILAGCGFVARSFSGDAAQVRELMKAALSHRGTAVLDIISPCVAFNNDDASTKSYSYGKEHEIPLHGIGFIPKEAEIEIEAYDPGEMRVVEMHDGSRIQLRKLEADYDPTDRLGAMHRLQWAQEQQEFITGLIYLNESRPSLAETSRLVDEPLSALPDERIRPPRATLEALMSGLM
ncbi:2-oxoacid:ferredoxin oxidoreductase subunit beta [Promineifilum sp.]|uniref:2-oxoacid:ferredoxin oxidoreductase subunit beta n=1 Tax=Promineifilum sp. TaxID=2664178 RepID=UPI0035B138DA